MTKRIISLALFAVLFVTSLGAGIYANVQATKQKALYTEQATYADKYQNMYDKAQKTENPILGSQYFKNFYQEKLETAQAQADSFKKEMNKYFIFASVLIFVSLAMLACAIITALPIVKMKKPRKNDEGDDSASEPKPEVEEKRKSDFDIILEAPKPHINNEKEQD